MVNTVYFFSPRYVSVVLVMMVVVVSPRWTYDAVVLTTLDAVQEGKPSPAANAVKAAINTLTTSLMICCLVIMI